MNKKGFTLIELLVVIAIIGILSSIAIVYLSDARQKANDAKVSSNITTASTQLELDRASDVNSDGTTPWDANIDIPLIQTKLGVVPCATAAWNETHNTDGTPYTNVAFWSDACTTGNPGSRGGDIYCADSQGFRGYVAVAPTTGAGGGKCNP